MLKLIKMEPLSVENIKILLKKHDLQPQKSLGQHFLVDGTAVQKLLLAAEIEQEDTVLEVGPGIGNLTGELAKRAKRVIAVEKDPNLVRILNEELKIENIKNVEIVEGDIRKVLGRLSTRNYEVVANIPYYLTAYLIRKFLESDSAPKDMTLIVQKEVAKRICAKPPDANLLSVSVQFYASPKSISYISKSSFWPHPKVDSAIIKITPRDYKNKYCNKCTPDEILRFRENFFRIVKAGFSQPRKQLINNLSKSLEVDKIRIKSWLLKNNIQPQQRAETLSVEDWVGLTKNFNIKR